MPASDPLPLRRRQLGIGGLWRSSLSTNLTRALSREPLKAPKSPAVKTDPITSTARELQHGPHLHLMTLTIPLPPVGLLQQHLQPEWLTAPQHITRSVPVKDTLQRTPQNAEQQPLTAILTATLERNCWWILTSCGQRNCEAGGRRCVGFYQRRLGVSSEKCKQIKRECFTQAIDMCDVCSAVLHQHTVC